MCGLSYCNMLLHQRKPTKEMIAPVFNIVGKCYKFLNLHDVVEEFLDDGFDHHLTDSEAPIPSFMDVDHPHEMDCYKELRHCLNFVLASACLNWSIIINCFNSSKPIT